MAAAMRMLLSGSGHQEPWASVGAQVVYTLAYTLLLRARAPNQLALDERLGRRGGRSGAAGAVV